MAVKKDRAAEALLAVGSKFVVNILAEGKEKPVIKQLLKPFKPGEDRFEGMDTQVRQVSPFQICLVCILLIFCFWPGHQWRSAFQALPERAASLCRIRLRN